GSVAAPLLLGLALGDLLHGLPINSAQNYTGTFWDLFQPYAVFTGVTLVLICALHGATFLTVKTTGELHERARHLARRIAPAASPRPPAPPLPGSPSGPTWRTATRSSSTRWNCWRSSPPSPPCGWSTTARTASPSPRPRSRWRLASWRSSPACTPT